MQLKDSADLKQGKSECWVHGRDEQIAQLRITHEHRGASDASAAQFPHLPLCRLSISLASQCAVDSNQLLPRFEQCRIEAHGFLLARQRIVIVPRHQQNLALAIIETRIIRRERNSPLDAC